MRMDTRFSLLLFGVAADVAGSDRRTLMICQRRRGQSGSEKPQVELWLMKRISVEEQS